MRPIISLVSTALAVMAFAGPAEAGHHGDAVVSGAAGFAIGTLFGAAVAQPRYVAPAPVYVVPAAPPPVIYQPTPVYYAPPPQWTPDWYSYCAGKYRSFDPRSGTYVGYDGLRYMCE